MTSGQLIPDFQSLMLPTLKALSGGTEVRIAEIRARVAASEGLTPEELRQLLPSGRQPILTNRVSLALAHLVVGGLVEKVQRGVFRLTANGQQLMAQSPSQSDTSFFRNYPSSDRRAHIPARRPALPQDDAKETPDRAAQYQSDASEAEVSERIREAKSDFGTKMRCLREERGVSLRQIAATTKISVSVLEALERNDISRLPGGIYSRAFVRSYAIAAGLDPEQTVRDFLSQFPQDSVILIKSPHAAELGDAPRSKRGGYTVAIVAILVVIGAIVFFTLTSLQ